MSDHDCQNHGQPAFDASQDRAQWLMALGACLLGGGVMAAGMMVAGLCESVLGIAGMMLVAGVQQIVYAFSTHKRGHRGPQQMSGAGYAAAGLVALSDPLLLHPGIPVLIGILVMLAGMLRGVLAIQERRERGCVCIGTSALVTSGAGAAILLAGSAMTVWMVGAVLAFELLAQGSAFFASGWSMSADATRSASGHAAQSGIGTRVPAGFTAAPFG